MRLGLFGGTFDPVHYGHLLLAESAREQCHLDAVWFVPAATPPHKQEAVISPGRTRQEMLELAVAGHEAFSVCPLEIERAGVSYTVDTLEQLAAAEHGAAGARPELFFLMGADSLHDLINWRQPQRICELALPVMVRRPGAGELDFSGLNGLVTPARLAEIRDHVVTMPLIELSSSDIRARVAAGQSIRYRTPRAVEEYIRAQGLYRTANAPQHLAAAARTNPCGGPPEMA